MGCHMRQSLTMQVEHPEPFISRVVAVGVMDETTRVIWRSALQGLVDDLRSSQRGRQMRALVVDLSEVTAVVSEALGSIVRVAQVGSAQGIEVMVVAGDDVRATIDGIA